MHDLIDGGIHVDGTVEVGNWIVPTLNTRLSSATVRTLTRPGRLSVACVQPSSRRGADTQTAGPLCSRACSVWACGRSVADTGDLASPPEIYPTGTSGASYEGSVGKQRELSEV